MRGTVHGVTFYSSQHWDRTSNTGSRSLGRIYDIRCGLIYDPIIEASEFNSYALSVHLVISKCEQVPLMMFRLFPEQDFGVLVRNERGHGVIGSSRREGTHIGRIAEHIFQRNECFDYANRTSCFHSLYLSATSIEISHQFPLVFIGVETSTFMIGSNKIGEAFCIASLKANIPAILKAISDESTS